MGRVHVTLVFWSRFVHFTKMLTNILSTSQRVLFTQFRRNLGVSAVLGQKAATVSDPIQQLFLEKIREYAKKSQAAGGEMVDVSADVKKRLGDRLARIDTQYGAAGPDFLTFPAFDFTDPILEAVGVSVDISDEDTTLSSLAVLDQEESAREGVKDKQEWMDKEKNRFMYDIDGSEIVL